MESGESKSGRRNPDVAAAKDDAIERRIREAGARARAEAEARRKAAEAARPGGAAGEIAREIGGRDGPEPARYGDWEVKGIASDF